eukprot:m.37750 g.37750  ORF g.37750 m.37750 type:complete len:126 (+) comp11423_c0_seq3:211-588(+)
MNSLSRRVREFVRSFLPFSPPHTPALAYAYAHPSPLFNNSERELESEAEKSDELSVFDTSLVLMAVPKRRTTHSKKRMRMTTKYLENKSHYQTCKHCGQLHMRHHICTGCMKLWERQQKDSTTDQ